MDISPMCRFTIRDVLWLTVVVGLAVCLWIQAAVVNDLKRDVKALRGDVEDAESHFVKSMGANQVLINELQKLTGKRFQRIIDDPKEGSKIDYAEQKEIDAV